ncbi:MAG: extracellular solute-binding protein [Actinomycetia bacterium]|nr:extracellular solute-binding protein [Actinomycetes bacterium]
MTRTRRRGRRAVALAIGAAVAAGTLAACGASADEGKPTLIWYVNPDPSKPAEFEGAFGQPGIAERCSTDQYTIETQPLPQDASQQRVQLIRRLAAEDPAIDLMSLDPVFTGELANADYLADIPDDQAQQFESRTLDGPIDGASWDDNLVVAPLWANTQLLWYRKSFAEKADIDMSQPVTWDQIIKAASDNGGTVGVQANKYEGYAVWINALVMGAGGDIVTDVEKGEDAKVTIDSEAGSAAAKVVSQLASSPAAQPDLSVSNEGTSQAGFFTDTGAFLVNWTYIYAAAGADKAILDDLGWTRYPRTTPDEESRPPLGGINIGVSAYSDNKDLALDALNCITSIDNQVQYAVETGNMPASPAAYADADIKEKYPPELLQAFQDSLKAAGPRPVSPYWSDISSAIQSSWHPPASVSSQTPADTADYIQQVLDGEALL